jgi:hypothetical protein
VLAALIAERSANDVTEEDTLSECIFMFDAWVMTPEGIEFWGEIYSEVLRMEEDFESPTELDSTPTGVEEAKIEIIPPLDWVRPVRAPLTYRSTKEPSFIDKVKLFFGK